MPGLLFCKHFKELGGKIKDGVHKRQDQKGMLLFPGWIDAIDPIVLNRFYRLDEGYGGGGNALRQHLVVAANAVVVAIADHFVARNILLFQLPVQHQIGVAEYDFRHKVENGRAMRNTNVATLLQGQCELVTFLIASAMRGLLLFLIRCRGLSLLGCRQ